MSIAAIVAAAVTSATVPRSSLAATTQKSPPVAAAFPVFPFAAAAVPKSSLVAVISASAPPLFIAAAVPMRPFITPRQCSYDGTEDGESHFDVVWARTAMVPRASTISKGARYEAPAVSGVNNAGKDAGRDDRLWSYANTTQAKQPFPQDRG